MFSVRVEFEDKMLRGIRLFAKGISHEHPQPGMQKPTPLFPLILGKPTRMTWHFSMNSRDPKPNLPNILGSGRPPAPQQRGSTFDAENSPVFASNWCHDFRFIRWCFFHKRSKPPSKVSEVGTLVNSTASKSGIRVSQSCRYQDNQKIYGPNLYTKNHNNDNNNNKAPAQLLIWPIPLHHLSFHTFARVSRVQPWPKVHGGWLWFSGISLQKGALKDKFSKLYEWSWY